MRYRDTELYHEQRLDDTGTEIIDLTFKDPLSAITLQFRATNGATYNKDNHVSDVIQNISIVNGGDVLLSASLKELQAIQAYKDGHTPYISIDERPNQVQRDEVTLCFGRYLLDPEYYLDLKKYSNPQLKITSKLDAVNPVGDTGFVSGSLKVSVICHVIEEGAEASKGFYAPKQIYDFETSSSGDEHIVLPIDYPYVGLMLHSPDKEVGIEDLLTKVKLSCDSEKFVPIDRYTDDLQRAAKRLQGLLSLPVTAYRASGERIHLPLYRDLTLSLLPRGIATEVGYNAIGPGFISLYIFNNYINPGININDPGHDHHSLEVIGSASPEDTTNFVRMYDGNGSDLPAPTLVGNPGNGSDFFVDTDTKPTGITATLAGYCAEEVTTEIDILARIHGRSLHNTLYLPFGHRNMPGTYFDSRAWNSIKLALTQAAVGKAAVCLLQLREFATAAH